MDVDSRALNVRYARQLIPLAVVLSTLYALLQHFWTSGPRLDREILLYLTCAAITSVLVASYCLWWARRDDRLPRGKAVLLAIASVVAARYLTAILLVNHNPNASMSATAFSYIISFAIPELIAGVTAYGLHRRIFG